jgi:hypothetical protein
VEASAAAKATKVNQVSQNNRASRVSRVSRVSPINLNSRVSQVSPTNLVSRVSLAEAKAAPANEVRRTNWLARSHSTAEQGAASSRLSPSQFRVRVERFFGPALERDRGT